MKLFLAMFNRCAIINLLKRDKELKMKGYDGYNPADYNTKETVLNYEGVNFVKIEKFYQDNLISLHFECNCSNFQDYDSVINFIKLVFDK